MTLALLLYAAPAFALLCALALRRYPGEHTIERLRARFAVSVPRRARALVRRARPTPRLPRGGRLVAAAVAARPPPGWMTHPTPVIHLTQGATP
jgi:hypothetical protein